MSYCFLESIKKRHKSKMMKHSATNLLIGGLVLCRLAIISDNREMLVFEDNSLLEIKATIGCPTAVEHVKFNDVNLVE